MTGRRQVQCRKRCFLEEAMVRKSDPLFKLASLPNPFFFAAAGGGTPQLNSYLIATLIHPFHLR
jgi:hypothetical protein